MSRNRIRIENAGFIPGEEFPTDERLRDSLSLLLENSCLFCDIALRYEYEGRYSTRLSIFFLFPNILYLFFPLLSSTVSLFSPYSSAFPIVLFVLLFPSLVPLLPSISLSCSSSPLYFPFLVPLLPSISPSCSSSPLYVPLLFLFSLFPSRVPLLPSISLTCSSSPLYFPFLFLFSPLFHSLVPLLPSISLLVLFSPLFPSLVPLFPSLVPLLPSLVPLLPSICLTLVLFQPLT